MTVETVPLSHGLGAVLVLRGTSDSEMQALRERLGLECRHGKDVRRVYGHCPACRAASGRKR